MSSTYSKPGMFIPKYSKYSPDGFGRDNYIIYNNGGFLDKLDKVKIPENYEVISKTRYFNVKKNLAPFKYHSDGTGRDTYVLYEHGGLERDHKSLKTYHLKDFLRRPESQIFNFRASPMREGINNKTLYLSKKEYSQNCRIKSLEKDLVDRLYYSQTCKYDKRENANKDHNYRKTLRNYSIINNINNMKNSNSIFENSKKTTYTNINEYNNIADLDKQKNNKFQKITVDAEAKQNNNGLSFNNLPNVGEIDINRNLILLKSKHSKNPSFLSFLKSKQKINQRLNLLSHEKLSLSSINNCFRRRLIIKDSNHNSILDDNDKFHNRTSKSFYGK